MPQRTFAQTLLISAPVAILVVAVESWLVYSGHHSSWLALSIPLGAAAINGLIFKLLQHRAYAVESPAGKR